MAKPQAKEERKVANIEEQRRLQRGGKQDEAAASKQVSPAAVQPIEPEDAYLTGGSRSLQRRLLGLNVKGVQGQAKPHPEATVAGIHSTGSYTSKEGMKPDEGNMVRKK